MPKMRWTRRRANRNTLATLSIMALILSGLVAITACHWTVYVYAAGGLVISGGILIWELMWW